MTNTAVVTMFDGTQIAVPDSLESITGYVVLEQQDWFEDEIKFLRLYLGPGQNVIDIGANHGVYSLSLGRRIQPGGKVWAFEPATTTARYLEQSIVANGLAASIHLERSGVSDHSGTATLSLNQDSEMNAVVKDASFEGNFEQIRLTTLDDCMEQFAWQRIDFLKIDAEGEEANIVKGGARFFDTLSPLVMFEVKEGEKFHLELVDIFSAIGYATYRLVPGLQILVPFDPHAEAPDDYMLNLFCCKADLSATLVARGLMFRNSDANVSADELKGDFLKLSERMPFSFPFVDAWRRSSTTDKCRESLDVLDLYASSQTSERSSAERFLALKSTFDQLCSLCQQTPTHGRLATLARVAREIGAHEVAVEALTALIKYLAIDPNPDFTEPFIPPEARFDALPPGTAAENWFAAATLEALEKWETYSSFYTGATSRQRLRLISALGFASPEMTRRLKLVDSRFPPAAEP